MVACNFGVSHTTKNSNAPVHDQVVYPRREMVPTNMVCTYIFKHCEHWSTSKGIEGLGLYICQVNCVRDSYLCTFYLRKHHICTLYYVYVTL